MCARFVLLDTLKSNETLAKMREEVTNLQVEVTNEKRRRGEVERLSRLLRTKNEKLEAESVQLRNERVASVAGVAEDYMVMDSQQDEEDYMAVPQLDESFYELMGLMVEKPTAAWAKKILRQLKNQVWRQQAYAHICDLMRTPHVLSMLEECPEFRYSRLQRSIWIKYSTKCMPASLRIYPISQIQLMRMALRVTSCWRRHPFLYCTYTSGTGCPDETQILGRCLRISFDAMATPMQYGVSHRAGGMQG